MELLNKSDKELKEIAQPIWDNLIKSSNIKDYGTFTTLSSTPRTNLPKNSPGIVWLVCL